MSAKLTKKDHAILMALRFGGVKYGSKDMMLDEAGMCRWFLGDQEISIEITRLRKLRCLWPKDPILEVNEERVAELS